MIIDAGDDETLLTLEGLAHTISDQVVEAGDEQRMKLHLAAVFCNNFVNHLYALAASFCQREGIDFRLLLPLIRETATRLEDLSPEDSQTGPAMRNDRATIEKHLHLLDQHPDLKKVYEMLSQSIYEHR